MNRIRTFELLCSSGVVAGAANERAIECAQNALGVEFPSEYQNFLENFGAALIDGVEIYGLFSSDLNDPPLWQSVVSVTMQLRNSGQIGADQLALVPISEDGTGVYFFLDTAETPHTKIWAIGPGVKKVVSSSLYEFVIDLSEGHIAYE